MQATNHLPIGSLLQGAHTYKIEQVLGQGSFGITYLASTRIKVDGALGALEVKTTVAIKEFFMRDINERAGEQVSCGSKDGIYAHYRHKFAREAENLSKLRHPNIVRVLEAFEANNTVYYAMEYCEGGSLDYLIGRDGLAEGQALAFVRQIASALDYMHSARILHLDLKPGNVMLREDGTVALIDFGLSKQYDEAGEPESSTTIGGGTPGYAPIEQAHYREGHDFPIQMDIYALGATLYKMLMGERPAEAAVLLNEGFPTHRLAAKGVSEPTIAVIEKAMSPIKRNRYGSVAEFLAALDSGTEGPVEPKVGENTVIEISTNEETVVDQPAEAPKPIPIKEEIKSEPTPTEQTPTPPAPTKKGSKKWLWTVVILLLVAGGFWGGRTAMTHLREQQAIADSLTLIQAKADSVHAAFIKDSIEQVEANQIAKEKAEQEQKEHEAFLKSTTGTLNGHDWIDLGLSVKWATCNIGASKSSDFGEAFAWGETSQKTTYTKENSKTYNKSMGDITSDPQYDAAYANWGSNWRLPTALEYKELLDKCKWERIWLNGHRGLKVTGPNGNHIFLPNIDLIDGSLQERDSNPTWGNYWSSTPHMHNFHLSYMLDCYSAQERYVRVSYGRDIGAAIRPVVNEGPAITQKKKAEAEHWAKQQSNKEKAEIERIRQESSQTQPTGSHNGHDYVDLGLSVKWATCNLGATNPGDYGDFYAWGETSPKATYTKENSKTYNKGIGDIAGNPQYDAAQVNWGGNWRLPTWAECQELKNQCTWTWTRVGYKVTSKNGNSIFIPSAGSAFGSDFPDYNYEQGAEYWSSTPNGNERAGRLFYRSGWSGSGFDITLRSVGLPIRPVIK